MALWPLADLGLSQFSRFTLEADLSTGRIRSSHIDVSMLSFASDLGSTSSRSAALALHYAVTPTWLFGMRYEEQRMSLGASPIVAGLQYPGSDQSSQRIAASMSYQY